MRLIQTIIAGLILAALLPYFACKVWRDVWRLWREGVKA